MNSISLVTDWKTNKQTKIFVYMKIEFQTSIVRLSFLCHITDIKSTWINPWFKDVIHLENEYLMASMLLVLASAAHFKKLIEPAKQACLLGNYNGDPGWTVAPIFYNISSSKIKEENVSLSQKSGKKIKYSFNFQFF